MEQAQNTTHSNVIDKLPPIVHELIDVLGYRCTGALIELFGGTSLKIPVQGIRDNRRMDLLIDNLGYEAFEKLMLYFGGEILYIPNNSKALDALRDEKYLNDFQQLINEGYSMNMAYLKLHPFYGKTDRWAHRLVAKNRHRLNLPTRAAKQSKVKQGALA